MENTVMKIAAQAADDKARTIVEAINGLLEDAFDKARREIEKIQMVSEHIEELSGKVECREYHTCVFGLKGMAYFLQGMAKNLVRCVDKLPEDDDH